MSILIFALLGFLAFASAGPVSYRQGLRCSRTCSESNKFIYETGKTYVYSYEANTVTTLQGTTEESSKINFKLIANIEVLSKCEFVLRLEDVRFYESGSFLQSSISETFRKELERHPLIFSFQDGAIEDICPAVEESARILNIKRGILSAFQNSMENFKENMRVQEEDVSGNCMTDYIVSSNTWGTTTIEKSKDLTTCTERYGNETSLQANRYEHNSEIKSLPLLKSTSSCTQQIHYNRLQKVTCTETQVFRPFSKGNNGAMTTTTQVLQYTTTRYESNEIIYSVTSHSNLLFDHKFEVSKEVDTDHGAREALRDLCLASNQDVRPIVPKLFARFVSKLRELNYDNLFNFYSDVSQICNDHAKTEKYFYDAIPMIGTTASVRLIRELTTASKISESEANLWLMSVAFISNPDLDMIEEISPLMNFPKLTRNAILTASTLVHSYCRVNPECNAEREIKAVIKTLIKNLGSQCRESDNEKVIISLKGLGTSGHAEDAVSTLNTCLQDKENHLETRLAAIEAFERIPCTISRDVILSLFKDISEDVEIRIASYLATMKCPSHDILHQVKKTLESEEVNQVGSFVWSHLKNLRKSSDPNKRPVQMILDDYKLQRQFNNDARKFSTAFEKSIFFESINAGAHVDGHVIMSPKSYIPRSFMVNASVDIFGSTINMFEFGGRAEGLESIVESLFKPTEFFDKTSNNVQNNDRKKRDINTNKIEELHRRFNAKLENDPRGSLYLKVFGNMLRYYNFDNVATISEAKDSFNILELLIKLSKEQDFDYSKNFMFLESSLISPTICGLPLRLSVNGTASINLKVSGKMDIRKMIAFPRSCDIKGHIKPSAAIEISSMMSVDAFVTNGGLKMVSTLHTSTALDGELEIKDSRLINIQLNMPQDKIEILDVQTQFFIVKKGEELAQEGIVADKFQKFGCSGEYTTKMLGIKFCSEIQFANASRITNTPYFPFTGPSSARFYITKTDHSLTNYKFEAKFKKEKVYVENAMTASSSARVSFNTPGSNIDREFTFDFKLDEADKVLTLDLKSPWKKIGMEGKYSNEKDLKRIKFEVKTEERTMYSALAEVRIDSNNNQIQYNPKIEIQIPDHETISFFGSINSQKNYQNHKMNMDLTLNNLFKNPVTLKGDFQKYVKGGLERYNADITFSSYYFNYKMNCYVNRNNGIITSKTDFSYDSLYYRIPNQLITTTIKIRNLGSSQLLKYISIVDIHFSKNPSWNTLINWEIQKTSRHFENKLELTYGQNINQNKLKLEQILTYDIANINRVVISSTLKATYPVHNIDFEVILKHSHTAKNLFNELSVKNRSQKTFYSLVNLNNESQKNLKMNGEIQIQYPGRELTIRQTLEETLPQEYHLESIWQWQRNEKIEILTTYKKENSKNKFFHDFETEIKRPRARSIIIKGNVKSTAGLYSVSASSDYEGQLYSFKGELVSNTGNNPHYHTILSIKYPEHQYIGIATYEGSETENKVNIDVTLDSYRHITGLVSLTSLDNKMDSHLEIKWDADRDETKKILAEVAYFQNVYTHVQQGSVIIKSPWKNIKTSFNTQSKGQLKSGNHKIYFDVEWDSMQKIMLTLDGITNFNSNIRQMNTGLIIITPFDGLKNINLKINHSDVSNEFNCGLEGKVNFDEIKIEINGKNQKSWNNHIISGKIGLTSSFKNFEEISASFKNDMKGNQINSQAVVQWARNKQINVKFDGSHILRRNERKLDNTLAMSTPFSGFETASVIFKHTVSDNNLNTEIQSKWGFNNRISLTMKNKLEMKNNINLESSIQFGSSFKYFENASLLLKHTHGNQRYKCHAEIDWIRYKKFNFDSQGTFVSNDFFINAETITSISTPFTFLKNAETKFTHNNNDKQATCYWEAKWNDKEKITLSLSKKHDQDYPSRDFESKVQFTSTFESFENLIFLATHKTKNNQYNSNFELQYGNGQIISLTNDFTFDFNSQFHKIREQIRFVTPFKNFESHTFTLNHDGSSTQYETLVSYTWNLVNKLEVSGQWKDFSSSTNSNLFGQLKYNLQQGIYSDYKVLEFSHNYNGVNLNCKTTLEWKQNDKYEFEIEVNNDFPRKYECKISLLSRPYNKFDDIILTGNFENRNNKYSADASFQWFNRKKISLYGNLKMDGWRKINGNINFKSPFNNIHLISAQLDFDAKSANSIDLSLNLNDKVLQIIGNLHYNSAFNHEVTITLRTPFKDYEEAIGLFRITDVAEEYKMIFSLQWQNINKIELNSLLKFTDILEFSSNLQTPFRGYENINIIINLENKNNQYISRLLYQWNPWKKLELNSNIAFDPFTHLDGTIALKTPFLEFESLSLNFRFTLKDGRFNNHLTSQWNSNKKITISSDFFKNDNSLEGKIVVTTPFYKYESLSLTGSYSNIRGRYIGNGEVLWNDNKISLESNIAATSYGFPNFEGLFKLKTPFKGFESWNLNLKQTYIQQKYMGNVEFEWTTYKKIIFSIENSKSYSGFDGKIELTTPFEAIKSIIMTYSRSVFSKDYSGNIQFKRNHQKNLNFEYKIRNHSEKKYLFEWNIIKKFVIDVTHSGHRNQFNGKTLIQTPYDVMKNFLLTYNYENRDTITGELYLENNDKKLFKIKYNTFGIKHILELHTPWQDMSGSFSSEAASNDFVVAGEICWNMLKKDSSTIKGEIKYNDRSHHEKKHCILNIKIDHPHRNMNAYFTLQKSSTNFEQGIDFSWNGNANKVSYFISANDMSSNWQKKYDASIKITYPYRALELSMKHEHSPKALISQAAFKWDADRDLTRQLTAKIDYKDQGRGDMKMHKVEVVLQHPKFKKDIITKLEIALNNGRELFMGKTELDYSSEPQKKLQFSTRLLDESSWGKTNYTLTSSLTYPDANLNIKMLSSIAKNTHQVAGNLIMSYQNRYRKTKNMLLRAMIDKLQKEIQLEMNIDSQNFLLNGNYQEHSNGRKNIYTFSGEGKINNQRAVYTELEFGPEDQALKLSLEYNPENRNAFYMSANMPNSTSFMIDTYRLHEGQRITEGQFALRLNNSQLLHSRLYWRPSIYDDIFMKHNAKSDISQQLNNFFRNIYEEVYYETSAKAASIRDNLNQEFKLMAIDFIQEINRINNEARQFYKDLSSMYDKNEFYLKDIENVYKYAYNVLENYIKCAYDTVYTRWSKFLKRMENNLIWFYDVSFDYYEDSIFKTKQMLNKALLFWSNVNKKITVAVSSFRRNLAEWYEDKLEEMLEYFIPILEKHVYIFHESLYAIETFVAYLWRKLDDISEHHLVQKISLFLEELDNYYANIRTEDYTASIKNHYEQIGTFVSSAYNSFRQIYNDKMDNLLHDAKNQYQSIMANEGVQMIADYCNIIYQQFMWLHNYLDIENSLTTLVYDSFLISKSLVKQSLEDWFSHIYGGNISRVIIFDPARGHIQYEQYLPFKWRSFNELPDFSSMPEYKNLKEYFTEIYPKDFSLWDYYYQYKPTCDYTNWIPPFKATATLVGAQHFVTFDGKFYNFMGECSYLLARDFIDGNFSFIVNYKLGKRTVSLLLDDKTLEIVDNKVVLNNKNVELPLEFGQSFVYRQNSHIIIHNKRGIHVVYDIEYDFYTFTITGWYYGKTAGLFGTYDNEPNTDFMTPDRTIARDVSSFAKSWAVDNYCSFSSNSAIISRTEKNTCDELFLNQDSHFRHCYKVVDPKIYHEICSTDENKLCKIAAAYRQECQFQGVFLHMPQKCIQCQLSNSKSIVMGETVSYKNYQNPKSADIVFVVENKKCIKESANKLDSLVKEMETYLRENLIRSNRYALVIYGEKSMNGRPQIQTINGEVFGNYQAIAQAINSLSFDDEGNGDHFSGIELASNYHFRPGVSKHIILMTCSKCEEQAMDLSYGNLHRILLERDITLHLFRENDFNMKGSNKKNYKNYDIFGVDKKYVYTHKDIREKRVMGDADLYQQIEIPKDICVSLALETKGTFFNAYKLSDGTSRYKKGFVEVFGKRFAKTSSICQLCDCIENEDGVSKVECRKCELEISNELKKEVENVPTLMVPPVSYEIEGQDKTDYKWQTDFKEYINTPLKKNKNKKSVKK